jgi:hypothetical protein
MKIMKSILILFCVLSFSHLSTAQTVGLSLKSVKKATPSVGLPPQYPSVFLPKNALNAYQNPSLSVKKPTQVPSVFSVEALPFFCKIEYKMGLNKKLPVKFRLGDVQYVDELEGKY